MMNGSGSSSSSAQQQVTPAAGNLRSLLYGGSGGGDEPPRHHWSMESGHQLDAAGRGIKRPAVPAVSDAGEEWEPVKCSVCEGDYINEERMQSHIRRCHVERSWRRVKEKSNSVVSGQEQEPQEHEKEPQELEAEAAPPAEAPAAPVVKFDFDLNVPLPEVEEQKGSSG